MRHAPVDLSVLLLLLIILFLACCAVGLAGCTEQIVTCSYDQTLHVYDFKENKCIAVLKGHTDWVYALAVLESKKG